MDKFPFFHCMVSFYSDKDILEVGKIISNKLFGGLPFGGLEDYIYDEVPAVYINGLILGQDVIIQGFGGEKGYLLEMRNYPEIEPDEVDTVRIDITGYVAALLEGTEGIQIKYRSIRDKGYIKIGGWSFDPDPPDVISANKDVMNKFPYFNSRLPFDSNKNIHKVAKILSNKLFDDVLPFGGLEGYAGLNCPILGLDVIVHSYGEEKGYCLEIKNHPDMIPNEVDTIKIDITGFIATLLKETEGINIDFESINKEYIKIG